MIHLSAQEVLATDPLLPIRLLAGIALIAVVFAFIYVLRHLRKIEKAISADNLVPTQLGPRNNMVLMICAIPIIIVSVLLFLIIET